MMGHIWLESCTRLTERESTHDLSLGVLWQIVSQSSMSLVKCRLGRYAAVQKWLTHMFLNYTE